MNTTIIYAYFGKKSSEKLANMIGGKCHNTLESVFKAKSEDDLVIRWGTVHTISDSVTPTVINSRLKILESSNKAKSRERLREYGVKVPLKFDWEAYQLPCIGRPSIHAAASGFFLCKTLKQAREARERGCTYFSQVFKKTHEFRVHCASGKILFVQSKPVKKLIASNDEAWEVLDWSEYNLDVCTQALMAVDCFDLDFAAVDVMFNAKTREACVCELNCAPALESDFQRCKYAAYFKFLQKTKGLQWWNWRKFKKAESLAWRKVHLEDGIPEVSRG